MAMVKKSMIDHLVDEGLITREQADQAQEASKQSKNPLDKVLVEMGFALDRDVTKARAQELNVPFVDLSKQKPEDSAVNVVPQHLARRHNVLPFKKDSGTNTLFVAMADLNNLTAGD